MVKPATAAKAAPPKGKAVTVAKTREVVPAFMKGDEHKGLENLSAGDYEIPRIKLIQAVSPELQDFDNAVAGEFWHTVAAESLGDSLTIVPVYIDKRYILWRPRHDGGGILARADDGQHWSPSTGTFNIKPVKGKDRTVPWKLAKTVAESGLDQWGTYDPEDSNSPPAATQMFSVVCMLPDFPELSPAIVTFQRSGIKVGRKFLGKLNISRLPIFGLQFTMSSKIDGEGDETYYNYLMTGDGTVGDEDYYGQCRDMHLFFKEKGVHIKDEEGLQDDADVAGRREEPAEDAPKPSRGGKSNADVKTGARRPNY